MGMNARNVAICQGSAALAINRSQLRVIEGGRSQKPHARARKIAPAKATSHVKHVCKSSSFLTLQQLRQGLASSALDTRSSLVIGAVCLCLMVTLGLVWRNGDTQRQQDLQVAFENVAHERIVVMPGDSLWTIAEQHPVAGCTTQQVVHHIREDNGLSSASLYGGMTLNVPLS